MQLRTLFLITLSAATLCASAQKRKAKKAAKAVPAAKLVTPIKPVPADTFSYAVGVAQSESLQQYLVQREGVDSAYLGETARAMREASALSAAEVKQRLAYAAGLRIAQMNTEQVIPSLNKQAAGSADSAFVIPSRFVDGLCDGLQHKATINAATAVAIADRQAAYQRETYKEKNAAFLQANKKLRGVVTLPSGLQYRVLSQGTGAVAADTTEVEVHYEGKLIDETVFDSSYKRGQTATFRPNQVIKGWREALQLMPEGSVYELYIPYDLGYGERGTQSIPPFSTLIFKVEVIKVKK